MRLTTDVIANLHGKALGEWLIHGPIGLAASTIAKLVSDVEVTGDLLLKTPHEDLKAMLVGYGFSAAAAQKVINYLDSLAKGILLSFFALLPQYYRVAGALFACLCVFSCLFAP